MTSFRRLPSLVAIIAIFIAAGFWFQSSAQKPPTRAIRRDEPAQLPFENEWPSEMRPIVEYYVADRGSLQRSYPVTSSPVRRERFRKFYADALERIQRLNFDSM